MTKLNHDAIEYLLAVAAEAGLELIEMDTSESNRDVPQISLRFRQTGKQTGTQVATAKISPPDKKTTTLEE